MTDKHEEQYTFGQRRRGQAPVGSRRPVMGQRRPQTRRIFGFGNFALKEGQKDGVFYTPESVVKLIVAIIEPYHGRIFVPACGSTPPSGSPCTSTWIKTQVSRPSSVYTLTRFCRRAMASWVCSWLSMACITTLAPPFWLMISGSHYPDRLHTVSAVWAFR